MFFNEKNRRLAYFWKNRNWQFSVSDIIKEEPTAQHRSGSVLGGALCFKRTAGSRPLNISDPKSPCFLFFEKKR
jgi:hypothetical protein